jgi:carbonic anhydrase
MDARIQVEEILGLDPGEAHCIRNAGGLATDDALRSLVLSHHLLGTDEILVIEHTACGQLSFNDDDLRRRLVEATGQDGGLAFLGFSDLEANLWAQVERIRAHPWLADVAVTGLIYDVRTGRLHEVGRP